MNGVVYCRGSSKDKEQIGGTSLESQVAACREYPCSKDIRLTTDDARRCDSALLELYMLLTSSWSEEGS
jgi:hypothetical protein